MAVPQVIHGSTEMLQIAEAVAREKNIDRDTVLAALDAGALALEVLVEEDDVLAVHGDAPLLHPRRGEGGSRDHLLVDRGEVGARLEPRHQLLQEVPGGASVEPVVPIAHLWVEVVVGKRFR